MTFRNPDKPTVLLRIGGGKNFRQVDVSDRILSFEYVDSEKKHDQLKIVLDNHNLELHDDPILRKGNVIEVQWGYPGNMSPKRSLKISAAKGWTTITVTAKGGLYFMNNERRTVTYRNVRWSDVARTIAERNGWIDPVVQFVADSGPILDTVTQHGITDAQMLRKLAKKSGFEVYIDFDGFHFHKRDISAPPARKFTWRGSAEGNVIDVQTETDISRKPTVVKVVTRDPLSKQNHTAVESVENSDREAASPALEVPDSVTGALQAAENLFVESPAAATLPQARFAVGQLNIVWQLATATYASTVQGGGISTEGEAQQVATEEAKRRFRKNIQTTVKLNLDVVGDPSVLAKTTFMFESASKRLSTKYYVKEVTHEIAASGGYVCRVKAISDGTQGYRREGFDELLDRRAGKKTKLGVVYVDCDPFALTVPPLIASHQAKLYAAAKVGRALKARNVPKDLVEQLTRQVYMETRCRPIPPDVQNAYKKMGRESPELFEKILREDALAKQVELEALENP